MAYSVGILIFNGIDVLDLAGPYSVLARATDPKNPASPLFDIRSVSRSKELVTCVGGLQIFPDHIYPDAHVYDVLLVPGGPGSTQAMANLRLVNWLERAGRAARIITGLGSGTFLLAAARLLADQPVADVPGILERFPHLNVVPGQGIVSGDRIVTAIDNMFGTDLALSIISRMVGDEG